MATQTQDNSGLYFIVGALFVVVAIIGFLFLNDGSIGMNDNDTTIIEKTEHTIEKAPEPAKSSLEMRVDEDGVSATSTSTQE